MSTFPSFPLTDAARSRPGTADLIRVAVHETGHALVAHELGLRVDSVEIRTDLTGHCVYRRDDDEGDLLAAAIAGEAAELEFGGSDPGQVADRAGPDRLLALGYARRIEPADPDRALRRGYAQAREVLQRYWPAVERFGEILLEERFLAGARLRALIDAAVGGASNIVVAAAAAIDKDRQAGEEFEIMVSRRLAFERLIREQPGVDERFAWITADQQARRVVAAMRGPRAMIGHGYLPRDAAQARIEAQTRDLRDELAGVVVATADFGGFGPNGGPMAVARGTRLRSDDAIVLKYPDEFRPLTEPEIARTVTSWRNRWRAAAGL
jgi:hypothetical protein